MQYDNVGHHAAVCMELNGLYDRKNRDYGDSFHKTYLEEGMAMARIRLSDKLERFKKLSRADEEARVKDESIRDTLKDLANYAIMTVMEMDRENMGKGEQNAVQDHIPGVQLHLPVWKDMKLAVKLVRLKSILVVRETIWYLF